jgi:nucleoid-associated protein YgaU
VRAGDTISGIANRFYGDWRLWRLIADRNELVDVRELSIGTRLLLPPKPLEKGRFEST